MKIFEHQAPPPLHRDETHARTGSWLLVAAIAVVVLFHGALLVAGSYQQTYDAWIHIFFGAHYAEAWFDPWEPRWYTGFLTVAYPPLSHQLIALGSIVLGLKGAFVAVQLGALALLTVGTYRFVATLAGPLAAGYAAIALSLSSAIAETVHIFGQLPTILSLAMLMNALPFVWRYLRQGGWIRFAQAVAWMAATTASHHVTTLFGGVFFVGPLVAIVLFDAVRTARLGEAQGDRLRDRFARRAYRLLPAARRTASFGVAAIGVLIVVVFPYWVWSSVDPILQVPIPHGSRENFLADPALGLFFWAIPWASTFGFLPYVAARGLTSWRWPLAASVLALALLGSGGTTPIPRWLLGGAYDILTLDRFTFWATILALPFVGMAIATLAHGRAARAMRTGPWLVRSMRIVALAAIAIVHVGGAIAVVSFPTVRPTQPDPIDVDPIVAFLDKDEHWRYRYLTLGFGDQMAWLSANTRASTPDGNYHSVRRLPELTTVPVERLEGAKYTGVPGIGSLEQFLETPERYHLKFVFSNDAFYDPLLFFHGWHSLGRLENGIGVWERDDVPPLPERLPRRVWPVYQRLMWGLLPPGALVLAIVAWAVPALVGLGAARNADAERDHAALPGERMRPPASAGAIRRFLAVTLVIDVAIVAGVAIAWSAQATDLSGATGAVIRYWDRVDRHDTEGAWQQIDPIEGLSFDRWILDRSVQGGLLSGYAKLDGVDTRIVAGPERRASASGAVQSIATVDARLTWFTSVGDVVETVRHTVVETGAGWRVQIAPQETQRPPLRFDTQAGLDTYRAPRRLTTADTAAGDVLDRPELRLLEARLVSFASASDPVAAEAPGDGGVEILSIDTHANRSFAIVGRIQNIDPRPADLTLTGILRNTYGRPLARTNAGTTVVHTLLPGETTPFRIDFDGVSAPVQPNEVVDADVIARAVVTTYGLERSMATWTKPRDGGSLDVRLVNVGTREATIPHALLSLYADERLLWVDEAYGEMSIAPHAREAITMSWRFPPALTVVAELMVADEDATLYAVDVDGSSRAFVTPRPFPLDVERGLSHRAVEPRTATLRPDAYLVQAHAFHAPR